eukprot:m.906978 g.906978  ORF g.906978 m.906978 type:complete len:409 (+) comp23710_c0_seq2:1507-2733(+)
MLWCITKKLLVLLVQQVQTRAGCVERLLVCDCCSSAARARRSDGRDARTGMHRLHAHTHVYVQNDSACASLCKRVTLHPSTCAHDDQSLRWPAVGHVLHGENNWVPSDTRLLSHLLQQTLHRCRHVALRRSERLQVGGLVVEPHVLHLLQLRRIRRCCGRRGGGRRSSSQSSAGSEQRGKGVASGRGRARRPLAPLHVHCTPHHRRVHHLRPQFRIQHCLAHNILHHGVVLQHGVLRDLLLHQLRVAHHLIHHGLHRGVVLQHRNHRVHLAQRLRRRVRHPTQSHGSSSLCCPRTAKHARKGIGTTQRTGRRPSRTSPRRHRPRVGCGVAPGGACRRRRRLQQRDKRVVGVRAHGISGTDARRCRGRWRARRGRRGRRAGSVTLRSSCHERFLDLVVHSAKMVEAARN